MSKADELSLVEKAAQRLENAAESNASVARGRLGGTRPAGQPATVGRTARSVEIDMTRLHKQGYLTPAHMNSHLAEEVRRLKRSVLQRFWKRESRRSNLIMISSALQGEGKSFISINLAISLACEMDLNVLLIDADFARPTIFNRLGLDAEIGLLDVLRDPRIDLGNAIVRTNIERLSLIAAGRDHALAAELLSSQRMREMADEIAQRYPDRLVIFDTSPILAAAESSVMAELMGQLLLVIQADHTQRPAVEQALELLPETCTPSLVLNRGRARANKRNLSYYAYRSYRKGQVS